MALTVKFLVFAHGNVVRGEEGASYDRDPLRKIRLKTDATYTDLLNAICTGVRTDPTTHQIKVHHRHPNKSVEGRVHYSLVPILDDDDVKDLIEMAEKMGEGSIQELYVEISDRSIALSDHETQQVVVTKPSTSQMPRSKRDPMTEVEDFTPKRPRHEMHLSKDINNTEKEINCALEDPIIEMSKDLIVADLGNEDPSENLMIHKLHDPTAFPMPPSSISMDIVNEMEDGNQPSRASSSTTPLDGQDYEVFLSFRGKETRCGFTDHLYNGLINVGVLVFRDDNELRVGEEIGPELLKAIKASRISIAIISKNYASSSWCLKELVQILECMKTSRQVVLPIFYQVEPSEVRNQTGDFGNGFLESKNKHYGEESLIQEWKYALGEVASLKGWESSKIANGHEGVLVRVIVREVLQVLRKVALPISDHLVGAEYHVQTIIDGIINAKESNDVQAIVIHGMGGIGKTTLAKLLYNRLYSQFERCSFLANIRATSQQHKGIEELQKQLISNISGQDENISNIDEGATIIKTRCSRKKVLILLDDIDHQDQLDALVGKLDWFGRGTIILITSRDKDLLKKGEDSFTYELNGLNANQSFMLFCMHAFKRSDSIPNEYNSIAKEIVSTTSGLPLAIEVIGSLLYGKGKSYWEGKLEILKKVPHPEVQKKLKISFDALEQAEKEIFLDIACLEFYNKEKREFAFQMWDGCGFCSQVSIENLISLSLIKRGEDGEFIIHDQLRDLGREIVRRESKDDLGQCSRIWKEDDALEVLELNKGTETIQTVNISGNFRKPVRCTSKQFKRITKLRYLCMRGMNLEGDFENLFQNLRWLCWYSGELDFMGSNFIPKRLVVLELFKVNIIEQWVGWSQMKHLRVLRLSSCYELITLPDLSALKELKVLILRGCSNLINIHQSIGKLKLLTELDLSGTEVTQLPDSIGDLCNLELLDLSYCHQLECLPNLQNSLTSLKFGGNLIEILPDFSNLTNLEHLQFTHDFRRRDTTLNFRNLNRITTLHLGNNGVHAGSSNTVDYFEWHFLIHRSNREFESLHTNLLLELPSTLVELELNDCHTLRTLPDFSDLKNLTALSIKNCPELMKIDGLDGAKSLTNVKIGKCKKLSKLSGMGISVTYLGLEDLDSLVSLPNLSTAKELKYLKIRNCRNLIEIQGLDNTKGIESVVSDGCSSLERIGDLCNLESLDLSETPIRCLPTSIRILSKLQKLNLSKCNELEWLPNLPSSLTSLKFTGDLMETLPDFSNLTNLEHLEFTHDFRRRDTTLNFRNLNRILTLKLESGSVHADSSNIEYFGWDFSIDGPDEGFESLHTKLLLELPSNLVKLQLKDCYTLRNLADFSDLKDLTALRIFNCPELMKIDGLYGAESLTSVMIYKCKKLSNLGGMGISVTHLELQDLDSLVSLPNLSTAKKLKDLKIRRCRCLVEIQGLDSMEGIESIILDGCSSLERISDLSHMKMLTTLKVSYCEKLREIRGLGISLMNLTLEHLDSLVSLSDLLSTKKLKDLKIRSCRNLVGIQGLGNMLEEICGISMGCTAFGRFPDHQNVCTIAESLEEQERGYVPDLSRFKNSNDIVEESCEISLGCTAFGRFPDHQNVCPVAESLEEQERGYVPDLSRFKNSNDIVEESSGISLGCPAPGRLPHYQSVRVVAEPLEEQGGGYLLDVSHFKNSNDIVVKGCEIFLDQ